MRLWGFILSVFVAIFALTADPARAQNPVRLALVIDQVNYTGNLSPLPGAEKEAAAVATSLGKTGFQVTRVHNANRPQLDAAFRDFRRKVSANPGAIVFIYYTGHGIRDPDSDSGDNYLLGVEADISAVSASSDLIAYGIQLQSLTEQFSRSGAKAVIFVLDACRTTPNIGKAGTKGLAPVAATANTLIAYSTGAGDVADVGVYAPVLAEELLKPGQDVAQLFNAVQKKVAARTGYKQLPWSNNLIYSDVCLVSCTQTQPQPIEDKTPPQPTKPSAWEIEKTVWEMSRDCTDYRTYLADYPAGVFASQAKARLAATACQDQKVQPGPPPNVNAQKAYDDGVKAYAAANYAVALQNFEVACSAGDMKGCNYIGVMYDQGLGVPEDNSRALGLYEKSCTNGYMLGCSNLGFMYEMGSGVAQSYSRAISYYDMACKANNATACANLGYLYENGRGVSQDYAKAATLYEKGCNNGEPRGCTNLGFLNNNGYGVPKNVAKAVALYERGCNEGNAHGCSNLGYMYANAQGVAQDYVKAVSLYDKSCKNGSAAGCTNLGYMHEMGQGVPSNLYQAFLNYEKACKDGHAIGCANLGYMHANARGTIKSMSKAVTAYQKACDNSEGRGCSNLAQIYRTGNGVTMDLGRARALYQKGCNLGNKQACTELASMN